MSWLVPIAWRYLVTAAAILVAGRGVTGRVLGESLGGAASPLSVAVVAVATTGGPLVLIAGWRLLTRPAAPQRLSSVGDDRAYCRDIHACLVVDHRGYLFAPRVRFTGGGLGWHVLRRLPRGLDERGSRPVPVFDADGSTWWMAGNEFYRIPSRYHPETVEAIIESLRWRRRPRLDVQVPQPASGARREAILQGLRPSLGRHNGLVCVSCRGSVDARASTVVGLWTDTGLRCADVQPECDPCRDSRRHSPDSPDSPDAPDAPDARAGAAAASVSTR